MSAPKKHPSFPLIPQVGKKTPQANEAFEKFLATQPPKKPSDEQPVQVRVLTEEELVALRDIQHAKRLNAVKVYPPLLDFYIGAAKECKTPLQLPIHKNTCVVHTAVCNRLYTQHKTEPSALIAKRMRAKSMQYIHVIQVYNSHAAAFHRKHSVPGLPPRAPIADDVFVPEVPSPCDHCSTHANPEDAPVMELVYSRPALMPLSRISFVEALPTYHPADLMTAPAVHPDKCRYCAFTNTYGLCLRCKALATDIKSLPIYHASLKMDMGVLVRLYARSGVDAVVDSLTRARERLKSKTPKPPPKQPDRDFKLTSRDLEYGAPPATSLKQARAINRAIEHHKRQQELLSTDFAPFPKTRKAPTPPRVVSPRSDSPPPLKKKPFDPSLDPLSPEVTDVWEALNQIASSHPKLQDSFSAPLVRAALEEIEHDIDTFASKQGDSLSSRVTSFFASVWNFLKETKAIVPICLLLLDVALIALIWWVATFEIETLPGFFFKISILSILAGITAGAVVFTTSYAFDAVMSIRNYIDTAQEFRAQREAIARAEGRPVDEVFVHHHDNVPLPERKPRPQAPVLHNHTDVVSQLNSEAYNLAKYSLSSAEREFKRIRRAYELAVMNDKPPGLNHSLADTLCMTLNSVCIRSQYRDEFQDDFKNLARSTQEYIINHYPEKFWPPEGAKPYFQPFFFEKYPWLIQISEMAPRKTKVNSTVPNISASSSSFTFEGDYPKKQNGKDALDGFSAIRTTVTDALTKATDQVAKSAVAIVDDVAALGIKDITTSLHSVATTVRDAKSLFDIFTPLVTNVVATVYEAVTGKIFVMGTDKIYHDKLVPILERIRDLEQTPNFNSLIIGSPDFRTRVKTVVDEYETLRTTFFKIAPDRLNTLFLSRLPTINDWKIKIFEGMCSGKSRPTPVMIDFVGLPASGKSTLAKLVFKSFHSLERVRDPSLPEWNQGLLYDRKVENEYWDGYNENPYIIMDDVLQALDVEMRFQQTMEIIQLVNTAPYQLHMSGVNDKANHFAQPKLLITTRNGEMSPSRLNISDPQAFYRRRTFLVQVVPNFKYAGCQPWDPNYLKYWTLRLHDPFGNFISEVTPEILVRMVHHKWCDNLHTNQVADPVLVSQNTNIPDYEIAAALKVLDRSTQRSLQELHHPPPDFESVDDEQEVSDTEVSDEAPRKQGNFIRSDEDAKLLEEIEMMEFANPPLIPVVREPDNFWVRLSKRVNIPRLRAKLKEPVDHVKLTAIEAQHYLDKARADIGESLYIKYTSTREWSVKKFEDIKRIVKVIPKLCSLLAKGAVQYIKEWAVGFAKDVAHFIKDNKWKCLFGAIGIALAIGGAVALATYFSRKSNAPDLQSRSEDRREERSNKDQQKRKEEEEARREQRIEAALRGGKNNRPAWKEFDDRIEEKLHKHTESLPDIDIVSKQYSSTDIPFLTAFAKNEYNANYCDETGGNHGRGQILFVTGRLAITAAHVVRELKLNSVGGQVWFKKDAHEFRCYIRDMKFDYIPNTEAGVLQLPPQCPQHHSIVKHFPTQDEITNPANREISEVNLFVRLDTGGHLVRELGIATLDYLNPYQFLHPDDPVLPYWTCPSGKTADGDSGGLWYTSNTKLRFRLLGVHSGGGKRTAFASPITQEMLQPYLDLNPPLSVPDSEAINFTPPEVAPGFFPEATLKQGASLPPRNDIVPSAIAFELYHKGWRTTTLPSVVKPITPFQHAQYWRDREVVFDGEFTSNERISPLEVIQGKLSFSPIPFPTTSLPMMLPNYYMDWPRPQGHYNVYHPHEIIYGLPALGVEHIRMDASPGYPFTVTNGMRSRKQIFGTKPEQCKPEFMERLKAIRDTNRTPGQYMPIYTLSIKVERRPVEKVMEANSRSIFGGPVDYQVMGQMFFYDLMQACIANCTSRITIGIDPHSKDWKVLYHRLRRHPNLIETDAKRWDNSQEIVVPLFFVDQFVAYLNSLEVRNRTQGFITKEELLSQARKVTIGCLQAYVISLSYLYSTWLQIKSGNFITTLFNCFLNELRWITVYAVAAIENKIVTNDLLKHYRANVEGAFHGDDSLLSVSNAVSPWFNSLSARYYWKKVWNIDITPAGVNKSNEFTPFVAWDKARFLKRGFAPDEDGHVYAPLELSVITDMVLWCTDASQNAKITKNNVAAALMEAAHHPRPVFDKLEADLKLATVAKGIPWVAATYTQYRQMFRRVTPPTTEFAEYARDLSLSELVT